MLDATTRYGRVSYTLRAEGGSRGAAPSGPHFPKAPIVAETTSF